MSRTRADFWSEIRSEWKKIGLFAAFGLLVGFCAAAKVSQNHLRDLGAQQVKHSAAPDRSSPAPLETKPNGLAPTEMLACTQSSQSAQSRKRVSNAEEIERLKARNRRLLALVQVLRHRADPDIQVRDGNGGQ